MISLSFSTIFDINQRKFKILDTTNYSGAGVLLSDVTGVVKITTPRGITHINTNYSAPDVNQSASLSSAYFALPTNAQGYIIAGAYSVEYSVKRISTSEISVATNSYTYSFIVPAPIVTQTVDGYNSIFSSIDNTVYGSFFSLIRTHEVTPPSGSPLSVITNSNQNIVYNANIWSGIWTSQLTSVLVYHESDGLIINVSLSLTQSVTAYLNDMNVIRGYIESFKLLYKQARATDKNLAYKYELQLENINTSYVEYDLALYYNDLATAYLRTVDIIKELSDYITITFPEDIVPFANHQGGSGHNPVSIGGVPYGASINTNQVLTFTLATTLSGGMLKQLSGNSTDYFGGDGNWHSLSSGTYALKGDFTAYDAVRAITATQITNWNTAFSWGNHASAGYALLTNVYTKTNLQTSGQSAVHWSNITNHPTTVSGYGILDAMAANSPITGATHTKITYDTKGLVVSGVDLSASDVPVLPWSKITSGKPTTLSGYGIIDSYTQAQTLALTWDFTTKIIGKPTTLSGYGIIDAYTQIQTQALTWDFTTAITGKPTTVLGYGITNALTTASPANNVISSGLGNLFLADDATYKSVMLSGASTTQVVFINGITPSGDSGFIYNIGSHRLDVTGILSTTYYVGDTNTIIAKDGGGNLVLTDVISGSATLATLLSGATNYWTAISGGISYTNYVGINNPGGLTEALTVNGNIEATDFNSSYLRYKNSNLFLGPNAGDLETGSNLLYISNTNTANPLILGDFLGQQLTFNADTYINNTKRLSFGSSDVYLRRDPSTSDLLFSDPNTNTGSPVKLVDIFSNPNYALKSDFIAGGYATIININGTNTASWNKASILSTTGSSSLFLAQDGTYRTTSPGVTPTDTFVKWDSSPSYYRYYSDKTEAGGSSSGGKLYLGTIDPTNVNRLNYDGAIHAFQFAAFASGSYNAIRGDSSGNGIGVQATSNSGIAFSAISNSNIGATINIGSGSSSDIAKFQKNSVDQVVINSSGINLITGATYKVNGVPITTGTVLVDGILHWDGVTLNPYTTQTAGKFDTSATIPVHTNALNYDGNLSSNKFLASDSFVTTLSGVTGILDSAGFLILDSAGYTIIDSTQSIISDATSTLNAISLDITINSTSRMLYSPGVTDGTTAIAYISDTVNSLVAAGAKLRSDRNNGVEKFSIDKDGNVNIPTGANYKINGVSIASGTPIDGIFHWDGTAYNPYSTQTIGKFDNSSTHPTDTSIHLNFNGQFWVTNIISGTTSSAVTAFNGYSDTASGGYFQTNSNFGCQGIALTSGTGVLGTSKTGKAGWFANDGSTTSSSSILYINKTGGGSINLTGDLIGIVDNPSTSGTISGSTLKATIDSTIRIDMNPRVVNGDSAVAYIKDTHNLLSTSGAKIESWRNQGTEKAYIDKDGVIWSTSSIKLGSSTILGASGNLFLSTYGILTPTVVDGSSAIAYTLNTQNTLSTTGSKLLSIQNNGTEKLNIDYNGTNNSIHFGGLSSTPTIVAGTGAGTSPTIAIVGTDAGFRVTLTTGTLPTSGGDICTVTFNVRYTTIPYAIHVAKSNYAGINSINVINTTTTTTLKLININSALQGSVSYIWDILIIQ
jgi:hypothetical protein